MKSGRTAEDIVKWVAKKAGSKPTSAKVRPMNCQGLEWRVGNITDDNTFILVFFGNMSGEAYETFVNVIPRTNKVNGNLIQYIAVSRNATMSQVHDEECAAQYNASVGDVVFFRNFYPRSVIHKVKAVSSKALKPWLEPLMVPKVIGFRDREHYEKVFKGTKPTIILL